MAGTTIQAIQLRTFLTAGLTPAYQPIYAGGLDQACFYLKINNASDAVLIISYDGVTDHDSILPQSTFQLSGNQSAQSINKFGLWQKTQIIYVRSATAPVGSIFLSGYYVQ